MIVVVVVGGGGGCVVVVAIDDDIAIASVAVILFSCYLRFCRCYCNHC